MSGKKVMKHEVKEANKEAVKDEGKDVFITVEELAKLSSMQHKRDMEIQQLGLNTYAWQLSLDAAKSNINNLIAEQKVLGKLILSAYGFDSDKEDFTIDLQTGKITSIGVKG